MKIKSMLSIFIMTFIFSMTNVNAVTEPELLTYNLTWNVENIYYYLGGSSTNYATSIANAAHNWVYTGYGYNRLYPYSRAQYISNSATDFYTYNEVDGANGYTTFFARVGGGAAYLVDPNLSNWLFSEIYLNDQYLTSQTSTYIQGVAAHEMGHAFGIGHNNTNPVSIMCQAAYGRSVYTVQQVDNNAFNRKHP